MQTGTAEWLHAGVYEVGLSLAASCSAGITMPCASSRAVPASPTAVPAAARPATASVAPAPRSRLPPAAAGRPSALRAATDNPARNITWAIARSGR